MEIDLSELDGKSFTCLDNCAMCCLCQPELDMDELAAFKKAGLTNGLTREHIQGYVSDEPTAISLQGGNGACHFLKNRRCTIYEQRTRFCRQFPVHVYALRRVQVYGNLSCRGITEGGNTLTEHGEAVLANIPEKEFEEVLAATVSRAAEFEKRCRRFGMHQDHERLRECAERLLSILGKKDGIGKLLAFTNSEPDIGEIPLDDVVEMLENTEPEPQMEEVANTGNYDQFELERIALLPVYTDEDLEWNIFQSKEGKIHWLRLEEDGTASLQEAFDLKDIRLLSRSEKALEIFGDYARTLNSRDHFLGYACQTCADQDYQYDLMTVYLGVFATTMLDLWWRASLVGLIRKEKSIDENLAREGIRAFDMGCLAMPSIGAFF